MTRKLFVVLSVVAFAGVSVVAQSKPSIQGAWRVAERTTTGPEGAANKNPQPSLWIFTAKHYSMMQDNAAKPRPMLALPPAGNLTEPQMVALYQDWAPVQANSGTYEISGSTLMLRPVVAKSTAVAASKTGTSYQLKMDGNSIVLTSVTGPTGQKVPNPTTIRLVRVE